MAGVDCSIVISWKKGSAQINADAASRTFRGEHLNHLPIARVKNYSNTCRDLQKSACSNCELLTKTENLCYEADLQFLRGDDYGFGRGWNIHELFGIMDDRVKIPMGWPHWKLKRFSSAGVRNHMKQISSEKIIMNEREGLDKILPLFSCMDTTPLNFFSSSQFAIKKYFPSFRLPK